jgi:dolichol-phosphate mannosyltransferase
MQPRTPLSVVVPCFDEAAVLPALHARLTAVCGGLGTDYEIVFVNDGSRDDTWRVMTDLAAGDPRLVCVNLSRNHGHQLALTAGLSECRGEAVLAIDADLQDPPELLPDMLAVMRRDGTDVVYGRRTARDGETWFKRATAHLFYRGLARLVDTPIPADTGDFRLMSRRVVDRLLAMPEHHRYVRGMVSWLGYKQVAVDYRRQPRAAGESKYTLRHMLRFAADAVSGFSVKPLVLPVRIGGLCLAAAAISFVSAGWWWLAAGGVPTGGLLAGLVLALAGGQFLTLGVMGHYLGRTYAEVRGRPLFLVETVVRGATVVERPVRVAA